MTFKTVPLFLLSLVILAPSCFSAPAPIPQEDAEPTPTSDAETPPSTVTAFFTPAVFLSDYYSQPRPTAENNAVQIMPEESAFPAPTTAMYDDLSPQETPAITPDATTPSDDALQATPTPDATFAMTDDVADSTTPSPTVSPALTVPADLTTASLDLLTATAVSTGTSTASSTYSSRILNPTATERPTQAHAADSRIAEQSRKTALIGTILALTFLSGLLTFAFCTGIPCRLFPCLGRKRGLLESGDDQAKDRSKGSSEKGSSSTRGKMPTPEIVVVPVLDSDASPQPTNSHVALPSQSVNGSWVHSQPNQQQHQQLQCPSQVQADEDDLFEDVTHILSEETFQADLESMGSVDACNSSGHRTSNGAASVTAESYATCESRYSSGVRASREDSPASFMSMSPPESPMLQTPRQPQYATVVPGRPRSKTLTQPTSPLLDKRLSSSRSLPARYAGLGVYAGAEVESVFEDSEWDIAEAYAARFSKSSTGVVQVLSPIAEQAMEAIEINGRSCVLVQG